MSLDVAPELLEQATNGEVDEAVFVATVRRSLPFAYALVGRVSAAARAGDAPFADNQVPPPSEAERGQLLRALASDAIGAAWSGTSGCGSAFQTATGGRVPARRRPRGLRRVHLHPVPGPHQSPELRNC